MKLKAERKRRKERPDWRKCHRLMQMALGDGMNIVLRNKHIHIHTHVLDNEKHELSLRNNDLVIYHNELIQNRRTMTCQNCFHVQNKDRMLDECKQEIKADYSTL